MMIRPTQQAVVQANTQPVRQPATLSAIQFAALADVSALRPSKSFEEVLQQRHEAAEVLNKLVEAKQPLLQRFEELDYPLRGGTIEAVENILRRSSFNKNTFLAGLKDSRRPVDELLLGQMLGYAGEVFHQLVVTPLKTRNPYIPMMALEQNKKFLESPLSFVTTEIGITSAVASTLKTLIHDPSLSERDVIDLWDYFTETETTVKADYPDETEQTAALQRLRERKSAPLRFYQAELRQAFDDRLSPQKPSRLQQILNAAQDAWPFGK